MSQTTDKENPDQTERATRYLINSPLSYRVSGTNNWCEGKTLNISRTGVLFQAEKHLPLQTTLEMRIALSLRTTLFCYGAVVRAPEIAFPQTRPSLAVHIRDSRLIRETKNDQPH